MKKISLLILLTFIISCGQEQKENVVVIKGKDLSGNVKQVNFDWIVENPINRNGENYIAQVDENSNFSIEIPLKRIAKGRIIANNYYHDICLTPSDDLFINLDGDNIVFKGKGAEKNNFLYYSEKKKLWDRSYYNQYNKGELSPIKFLKHLKKFKAKRLDFLATYTDSIPLEKEFIDSYKINTKVIYENLIPEYADRYFRRNKISKDSLKLPEEYKTLNYLSSIVDDSKTTNANYVTNITNKLYAKAGELSKKNSNIKYNDAIYKVLFDSLSGKTREYVLTNWIVRKFSRSEYDTVAVNKFNEIKKDELAQETFNESLKKFNVKQSLIGQPLHTEFYETKLKDTNEVDIKFGEMMEKYKDKVVYLDIWSLRCGPCIQSMPWSKKLKEKLVDLPIEFVYITQDKPNENLWKKVFEKSLTKENHYRMTKYKWGSSRMLKFMEISSVPRYMIFDKNGRLVNYSADRPSEHSSIEKTLRKLATK